MRVVLQGEIGSFHHLAARHWFDDSTEYVAADSFANVFAALEERRAEQAVIAIENSLFGSINEVYDLLAKHRFPVIGELSERIHQNLITLPGATLENITEVYSHPVALAQCSEFLGQALPQAERVEYHDTAAAVNFVRETGNIQYAAIASSLAAKLAGDLPVLESNIENERQNYTRFLVIDPSGKPPKDANKASLVLRTSHEAGALYNVLAHFAEAKINMTKLQSRPIIGKVWHYQFYVDVEAAGSKLHEVVKKLENQGCTVDILGEYKADATQYND